MTRLEAMKAAFQDELQKIAGELQGYVRSGRKPIGVERLLEKETEAQSPSDILKLSSPLKGRDALLLAGGAGLYHQGRKVKRRYDIGKQVETQGQY